MIPMLIVIETIYNVAHDRQVMVGSDPISYTIISCLALYEAFAYDVTHSSLLMATPN